MNKDMKKILAISLIVLCIGTASFAKTKDNKPNDIFMQGFMAGAQAQAKVMLPLWEKASTCTPVKSNDGQLEVYGKENGKCHIRYVKNDCYLPNNVLKKYTKSAIKNINDTLAGKPNVLNKETRYMDSIQHDKTYCQVRY